MKADERLYFENDLERGIERNDYPEEIFKRHIDRYHRVIEMAGIKGGIWLDCGCGSGYGTELISNIAENAIGIEIDRVTIKYARKRYPKSNLIFLQGDINEIDELLKQYRERFDVIACIEVLEHLKKSHSLLRSIYNLLKPNGSLIITTPLSNYGGGPNPSNRFHVNEYTFEQLFDFLSVVFDSDNIVFHAEKNINTANKPILFIYAKCIK